MGIATARKSGIASTKNRLADLYVTLPAFESVASGPGSCILGLISFFYGLTAFSSLGNRS